MWFWLSRHIAFCKLARSNPSWLPYSTLNILSCPLENGAVASSNWPRNLSARSAQFGPFHGWGVGRPPIIRTYAAFQHSDASHVTAADLCRSWHPQRQFAVACR